MDQVLLHERQENEARLNVVSVERRTGGKPCVDPSVVKGGLKLHCSLPFGAGTDQLVVVTIAGHSTDSYQGVSYADPDGCAAGSGYTGNQACGLCPGGKYGLGGKCNLCARGTFTNIAPGAKMENCEECPAGTGDTADRASCVECDVGTFGAGGL